MFSKKNLLPKPYTPLIPVIREYRAGDYPRIETFWNQIGLSHPSRGDSESVVEKTLDLGGKLLIMEHPATGEILGTAWMTYDGRRISLHHFGIQRIHQRQGFGYLLGLECLRYAQQMNTQIRLDVHDENTGGIGLYKKLGFHRFDHYHVWMIREVDQICFPEDES